MSRNAGNVRMEATQGDSAQAPCVPPGPVVVLDAGRAAARPYRAGRRTFGRKQLVTVDLGVGTRCSASILMWPRGSAALRRGRR
jgi:hypothetical protein